MTDTVNLDLVSRALELLLKRDGRSIQYDCKADGVLISNADSAAAVTGFLPAILVAADGIWRQATGRSLGVQLAPDPTGILGYSVVAIRGATFSTVMLTIMEALARITPGAALLINDLAPIWAYAMQRAKYFRATAPGGMESQ